MDEGCEFFANYPRIYRKLKTLSEVGLGYIKIGQRVHHAVGRRGAAREAGHRAVQASRPAARSMCWTSRRPACTPPTWTSCARCCNRLVDAGNTVVVIEHNLDVIKNADYIIDMGPEGGDKGGTVVGTGTPEELAANPNSYTGQYLKPVLEAAKKEKMQ